MLRWLFFLFFLVEAVVVVDVVAVVEIVDVDGRVVVVEVAVVLILPFFARGTRTGL